MKVRIIKAVENAVIPAYAKPGDAGLDLTAVAIRYDHEDDFIEYDTGIIVEIPEGHVGLVFPRSSISKLNITLTNSVGVVDSQYRGTIRARFRVIGDYEAYTGNQEMLDKGIFKHYTSKRNFCEEIYKPGDRIAQLIIVPYPTIEFEEVTEASETERGKGGYGSTGD
jgi:dUTP pyrophosphatase